jgi:uncharacterized membrane protein
MAAPRDIVTDWAEEGRVAPPDLPRALALTGVTPSPEQWRTFLATLLLSLGALLIAAGIIFFFAYNWMELGRFAKFALLEGAFVAASAAAWHYAPSRITGQAALLLASLLTGSLLALIGQTYQTGADTYQLFAAWAILVLPWVVVSRAPVLWLLLITLVNVTTVSYFETFRGLFGIVFAGEMLVWVLFILNGSALVVWEVAARRGLVWMQGRWAPRLLATATGIAITSLALSAIVDRSGVELLRLLVYLAWLGTMYAYYRRTMVDLFALAGGVLSVIVSVTAALARVLLEIDDGGAFLLIGLVVIAMSAAGAWWLREIAAGGEQ